MGFKLLLSRILKRSFRSEKRVVLRHERAFSERVRERPRVVGAFVARAARPTAFLCNETRTHHAKNSSVLVSHPRDHNCSAVVIPNMPGQLHSGASIRVPCDPILQDHGRLLRLLLGIEWTVPRVHVWHDMLEHPNLVPR